VNSFGTKFHPHINGTWDIEAVTFKIKQNMHSLVTSCRTKKKKTMFQLPDIGICPEASRIKHSTNQNFTDTEG
jgi:hypothetical protein